MLRLDPDYIRDLCREGALAGVKDENGHGWLVPLWSVIERRRHKRFWIAPGACIRCGMIAALDDQHHCEFCQLELAGWSLWYDAEEVEQGGLNHD